MSGIQSIVSTMQAQFMRHEVLANNLANLSTPGFKQDGLALIPSASPETAPVGSRLGVIGNQALLQWTDFSQGFLRETGRHLDVALNGRGFFAIETPTGTRYTRAGLFSMSQDGTLVTPTGFKVLGERGPIVVGNERVTITPAGEVVQDGRVIDTLRLVDFPRPYRLVKEGGGLFAVADATVVPQPARETEVVAGSLEGSNVNPVETMVTMIDLLRRYEAAQRSVQATEEANRQATNEIGRV